MTAANQGYYAPMQAAVSLIHQHLPHLRLIIYDLGLSEEAHAMVIYLVCNLFLFAFPFTLTWRIDCKDREQLQVRGEEV